MSSLTKKIHFKNKKLKISSWKWLKTFSQANYVPTFPKTINQSEQTDFIKQFGRGVKYNCLERQIYVSEAILGPNHPILKVQNQDAQYMCVNYLWN